MMRKSPGHDGWTIERLVPVLGGTVALTGLALGRHKPPWRMLTGFAAANLVLYGLLGWCPATLLMSRAGLPHTKCRVCAPGHAGQGDGASQVPLVSSPTPVAGVRR